MSGDDAGLGFWVPSGSLSTKGCRHVARDARLVGVIVVAGLRIRASRNGRLPKMERLACVVCETQPTFHSTFGNSSWKLFNHPLNRFDPNYPESSPPQMLRRSKARHAPPLQNSCATPPLSNRGRTKFGRVGPPQPNLWSKTVQAHLTKSEPNFRRHPDHSSHMNHRRMIEVAIGSWIRIIASIRVCASGNPILTDIQAPARQQSSKKQRRDCEEACSHNQRGFAKLFPMRPLSQHLAPIWL